MLDRHTAQKIAAIIEQSHDFVPALSTKLITDQTTGYIPNEHVETYLSTGLFTYDTAHETLRFEPFVQGFDAKTAAMTKARDALIAAGLIKASAEPHFQERAVGGQNRLIEPEFKIDRAHYRHFGFPSDAVFLNVILENDNTGPRVLLQRRSQRSENGNTYDFAAGGAVKFPQTVQSALADQIKEETGTHIGDTVYDGFTTFKFSTPEKRWVTNQTHNLFHAFTNAVSVGSYNEEEVSGFQTFTPEDAVHLCATGAFNAQNTQAFMASMKAAGIMPAFDGAALIDDALKGRFQPARSDNAQQQGLPPRAFKL